jgi:hypothetical protein
MVNNINIMGEGGCGWREVVVAGGREEGENTQWGVLESKRMGSEADEGSRREKGEGSEKK